MAHGLRKTLQFFRSRARSRGVMGISRMARITAGLGENKIERRHYAEDRPQQPNGPIGDTHLLNYTNQKMTIYYMA